MCVCARREERPDATPPQYSVPRPFSVPMVGHAVCSLIFRDVVLDDALFGEVMSHCPSLTSLDLEARVVDGEPLVSVGTATIAQLSIKVRVGGRSVCVWGCAYCR